MADSAVFPIVEIKEEFSTCEVCIEYYDDGGRCPRILPCHHTFCTQCLNSLWRNSPAGIKCPNCREVWPVKNNIQRTFPQNKVLMNLVEYITMKDRSGNLMCYDCPNGSCATVRCLDCQEYMCDACRACHKKFAMSKQHTTVLITELQTISQEEFFQHKDVCEQHKSINLDLFCETCSTAVCYSCALVSHRNHDICNLIDVYEKKKEHLISMLRGLQASTETSKVYQAKLREENTALDVMQATLLQGIDDSYDKIIRKLSDRRKQLKEDVVSNIAKQKADRDEEMELIAQSECVKVEQVLYCQQALSFAQAVQFIEMSQDLENKIKTLEQGRTFNNLQIQDMSVDDTFKQIDKVMEKTAVIYDGMIASRKEQDSDVTRKMLLNVGGHLYLYKEILLPSVEFDNDSLNWEACSISANNTLLRKPSPAPECDPPARLKRLRGVRSRSSISSVGASYWETEVECVVLEGEKLNCVAAQVGLCCENHCDDDFQIADNKHAWCVSVESFALHNSLCVLVLSRGKCVRNIPIIPFKPRTQINITIGLLLDSHTRRLHVIHVNDNKLLYSISDVDVSQSLMPVFSVYNPERFKVKMRVEFSRDLTVEEELQTLLSSLIKP